MNTQRKPDPAEACPPVACRSCDLNAICRITGVIAYESGRPRQATGSLRTLRPGAALFRAGAPAHALFAVRQGMLKLTRVTPEGDERIIAFPAPGEVFGFEVFSSGTYACDAIALEPLQCCELPLRLLNVRSRQTTELAGELIELLSRAATARTDLARGPALQRVTNFLLDLSRRLANRGFSATRLKLSMSRFDIANFLDTRIETISRALQQLHRAGSIQVRGSRVHLLTLIPDDLPDSSDRSLGKP